MSNTETTKHYPRAIAMLMGTIIGVGIFGLPYVIARSGVAIGLVHLAVLTLAVLIVHLAFSELTLRTTEPHRLVGYAGRYLGRAGWSVATVSTVLGMYGVLLAYLIVGGQFLSTLLQPFTHIPPVTGSIAVGVIMLVAIAFGLRLVEELEFLLTAFLFIAMAVIVIVGAQRVDVANWMTVHPSAMFLPYGAVLFSLGGVSVIAELRELLRGRERLLPHAITWGTILASLLTTIFVLTVVGVSGRATTPEAIAGLLPTLGRSIVILGALLGFLAITTSFLTLGLYLNEVFRIDFRRSRPVALLLSVGVPFVMFLLGNPSFTQVILITGAVFGGLDGILVIASLLRARRLGDRQPEFRLHIPAFLLVLVALLFAAGMVTTIIGLTAR